MNEWLFQVFIGMEGLAAFRLSGDEGLPSSSSSELQQQLTQAKQLLRGDAAVIVEFADVLRVGEQWHPALLANIIPQLLTVFTCTELYPQELYSPQHGAAAQTVLSVLGSSLPQGRPDVSEAVAKLKMSDSVQYLLPGRVSQLVNATVHQTPIEGLEPDHYGLKEHCSLLRFVTQHVELLLEESLNELRILGELLLGRFSDDKEVIEGTTFGRERFAFVEDLELGVSSEFYCCFALLLAQLISLRRESAVFSELLEDLRTRAYNENLYFVILVCESCLNVFTKSFNF